MPENIGRLKIANSETALLLHGWEKPAMHAGFCVLLDFVITI
jgi:hypothetical protein